MIFVINRSVEIEENGVIRREINGHRREFKEGKAHCNEGQSWETMFFLLHKPIADGEVCRGANIFSVLAFAGSCPAVSLRGWGDVAGLLR